MPRPQALPVTRKTLVARGAHGRAREQRRIGRRDVRLRPADREERVDALDRVEQARGRHALVDLAEDPRSLHLLAQLALAGQVERDRAERPRRSPRPRRRRARGRRASRATRSGGSTNRLVRIALPAIEATLWSRSTSTAAPPSATSGVYGDSLPDRNWGASLAPRYAPTAMPASRGAPPIEPAPEPDQRRDRDHGRPRSSRRSSRRHPTELPATLSVAPGGVVQLVRTPACHAGGRGFESRRSRSISSLQTLGVPRSSAALAASRSCPHSALSRPGAKDAGALGSPGSAESLLPG